MTENNNIEIIEQREMLGHSFTIYGTVDNPLFLARDIAEYIGIDASKNTGQMVKNIPINEIKNYKIQYKGQLRSMIFLTEKGVKQVLANSRKLKAKELLHYLDNEFIYKNTPKQTTFELMLNNALDVHINKSNIKHDPNYIKALEYKTEYTVGAYRLDIYFPEFDLIVEYDEKYHNSQQESDRDREADIIKLLGNDNIQFIRVKEGLEFEGVIQILSMIMHKRVVN